MLLKITEMGKDWRHEDRFRESNIKHSGFVAYLSLLLKDHKKVKEGQPFPTRPVVAANEGIGASLSNILSEMLDPLADSLTDKMEIISTEDGISRYKDCNKRLAAEWTQEDSVGLIGADVSKLFQSLYARQTAQVIREISKCLALITRWRLSVSGLE